MCAAVCRYASLEAIPLKPGISFALGQLEYLATIGTGTFGRVRLVRHSVIGKYFALKIMKKTEARGAAVRIVVRVLIGWHLRRRGDGVARGPLGRGRMGRWQSRIHV